LREEHWVGPNEPRRIVESFASNVILAKVMLEHSISQETLPNETGRMVTFMKDYATVKMDGDRITGYLKKLDDAMKYFKYSRSDYCE
jgi:hypothetical protein